MYPFNKGFDDLIMVVQISGLNERYIRMAVSHGIGKTVNAVNQYPRKQKIRKYHNALEA